MHTATTREKSATDNFLRELFAVNLDHTHLKFNNFELENYLDLSSALTQTLVVKYKQELILKIPMVLGSVGAIGDPTVLLSSIGNGVRDFFYEPALGNVLY